MFAPVHQGDLSAIEPARVLELGAINDNILVECARGASDHQRRRERPGLRRVVLGLDHGHAGLLEHLAHDRVLEALARLDEPCDRGVTARRPGGLPTKQCPLYKPPVICIPQFPGNPQASPPTVSIVAPASALAGEKIALAGSVGKGASFSWQQTAGAIVALGNADTLKPDFAAPAGPAVLTFTLSATGANGVSALLDRLLATGRDLRALGGVRLAAIGPATADALRAYHLVADVVPAEFNSEGLVEGLREIGRGHV